LTYIGNCGTGFKDQDLKEIKGEMVKYIVKSKPFDKKVNQEKLVTWLKPILVCEVNFAEWTQDHHLRHPVFKGLRLDKNKEEILEDKLLESTLTENTVIQGEVIKIGDKDVKLTHLNKIYWPEEKITKGDLITYYSKMAKFILPYLKDKPLSLNRHPNGINQPNFFQKDVNTDQIPTWVKTAKIHSDSTAKEIDYLLSNDEASLLYMANLGCIEINPWLGSFKKPNTPDFMVIDLDPDNNSFSEVIKVALEVKANYDEMGIKSFVKTSGSTGIHIYVYVGANYDYDLVKNFAQFIAQKTHEKLPDITSLERSPLKRKHKIYIDYLQNRRGQTIAAPYSVRPKPGATVSFPLKWDEVNDNLNMNDYHLKNVPDLVKKRKNPWQDILSEKQDLMVSLNKVKK
jgi:bifunctional non-homologous end joining protein LigD